MSTASSLPSWTVSLPTLTVICSTTAQAFLVSGMARQDLRQVRSKCRAAETPRMHMHLRLSLYAVVRMKVCKHLRTLPPALAAACMTVPAAPPIDSTAT